jgi:hypothetical protein
LTLKADSAEYYGDQDLVYLIGNVHYTEPRATIDADRATYWTAEGHLHAEGNVYAVTDSGNTMRGPVAEYYKAMPGVRTEPIMNASGRPRLGLVQRDSVTRKPSDTVYVVADRINSTGNNLVYAGGTVQITRPDLFATGDSAYVDNRTASGRAQLLVSPKVESKDTTRAFTLTGGMIDIYMTNRQVDRIVATPEGHVVSEELQLFADSIDMRVHDRRLQRAMAWGKTRARAVSPDREITADSIDAVLPNQQVREIRAVRDAYATSIPDTTTIITTERDWLRGDTIIAVFDTVPARGQTTERTVGQAVDSTVNPSAVAAKPPPARDTLPASIVDMAVSGGRDTTARDTASKSPPLKSLVVVDADGTDARAYYHMANQDKIKDKPSVNYVRGRSINLAFEHREVQTVTVLDQASGVYLEAVTDSTPTEQPVLRRPTPPRTGGIR